MRHMSDIKSARRSLGLSQAELAAKLGVHQTTISRFETGDLPLDERTKLALDALTMRARPADSSVAA
jgi:ribosome-binding protein aMBF1 (putative translation factor)